MACKPVCKLCNHLVLSQNVTFTGGNLVINLPAGAYNNGEKYCIVVAQAIPNTTTINAPVVITIRYGHSAVSVDQPSLCAGDCLRHSDPDPVFHCSFHQCYRRHI